MKSICIATYNGHKFIKEQLFSILQQIDDNDEILVSDDGSTDDTIDIVKSIGDSRISILPPPVRKNLTLSSICKSYNVIYHVSTNFINALRYVKGDTIYFCDQDDVWLQNKVDTCERILKENVITVHRRIDVDESLSVLKKDKTDSYCDNRKATFFQSLKVNHFQGACMAFTKELRDKIIQNVDLFYTIPLAHDHAIGYIAMTYFQNRIDFNPTPLILYRRHGANVSPTGKKSNNPLLFKVSYRLNDILFYMKLLYRKHIRQY